MSSARHIPMSQSLGLVGGVVKTLAREFRGAGLAGWARGGSAFGDRGVAEGARGSGVRVRGGAADRVAGYADAGWAGVAAVDAVRRDGGSGSRGVGSGRRVGAGRRAGVAGGGGQLGRVRAVAGASGAGGRGAAVPAPTRATDAGGIRGDGGCRHRTG